MMPVRFYPTSIQYISWELVRIPKERSIQVTTFASRDILWKASPPAPFAQGLSFCCFIIVVAHEMTMIMMEDHDGGMHAWRGVFYKFPSAQASHLSGPRSSRICLVDRNVDPLTDMPDKPLPHSPTDGHRHSSLALIDGFMGIVAKTTSTFSW